VPSVSLPGSVADDWWQRLVAVAGKSSSSKACNIFVKRENHFTFNKQDLVYRIEPVVANSAIKARKKETKLISLERFLSHY
jgi:hypothetical protein